jgi:hypothetical protein
MRYTLASCLLLSSLFFTAVADASPPSDHASAPTSFVSTGVTPPRLLNSLEITYPDTLSPSFSPPQVQVSFLVDTEGRPRDIQIVKGINPLWNAAIAQAIGQLRYQPASLDHKPIPMAITLDITLAR